MREAILLCTLAALIGLPIGYGIAAIDQAVDDMLCEFRCMYLILIGASIVAAQPGGTGA